MKTSAELGAAIVRALSLPERTRKVELVFEVGKAPIVRCEYQVHCASGEGLLKALQDFELAPKGAARIERKPTADEIEANALAMRAQYAFHIDGPTDKRTQQQVANYAVRGLSLAKRES